MTDQSKHKKPLANDNQHHGLPEDAPHSPNPHEDDDVSTPDPDTQGEVPRKRDDSGDAEDGPFKPD